METTLIAGADTSGKLTRQELAVMPTPGRTATHQVIPHIEIVETLIESMAFRHMAVTNEEYAVSRDGNNFFGVMTLDQGMHGAQFALGIRNSHNKQFRLSIVVGLRIFVCSNLCFSGDFDIVLAKHTKSLNIQASISIGLDAAQRGFEPMRQRVENWRNTVVTDDEARVHIFRSFVEEQLEAPKHLAREVWRQWANPQCPEFEPRTRYSLNNAYTGAFQQLDPIPKYKATASLAQVFN